jgi:SPP1 family predicted phage head-tail adaptor
MRAGALRAKVTIQTPVEVTDAKGGLTLTSWTDAADVWAEIDPTSSRKYVNADQLEMLGYHTIRLRYTGILTPNCRLKNGTRIFYISSFVNTNNRNRELLLTCTEEM